MAAGGESARKGETWEDESGEVGRRDGRREGVSWERWSFEGKGEEKDREREKKSENIIFTSTEVPNYLLKEPVLTHTHLDIFLSLSSIISS